MGFERTRSPGSAMAGWRPSDRFVVGAVAEVIVAAGADWFEHDLREQQLLGRAMRRAICSPLPAARPATRTFHDLRRTDASLMIAAVCHVKVIAEQIGHSDGGALGSRAAGTSTRRPAQRGDRAGITRYGRSWRTLSARVCSSPTLPRVLIFPLAQDFAGREIRRRTPTRFVVHFASSRRSTRSVTGLTSSSSACLTLPSGRGSVWASCAP